MTDSKNFIIPVSDWGKLTRAFGEKGVPVPFVKEIFLPVVVFSVQYTAAFVFMEWRKT